MRYSTRMHLRKIVFIALAIIVFVIINIVLFTTIINKSRSIEKSVISIANGENAKAYPYDGGVIAVDGYQVISYDYLGQKQYETEVPYENMQAYRKGNYTVLWSSNIVIVLDVAGQIKHTQDLGSTATMAVCNSSQFAVALVEEGQNKIRVYDFNGIEIWDNLFTDMSILNIGYFGEKDQQLWTLVLDYHGTLPITRLYANNPGSSQTGRITVNDQICYSVVPLDDLVYLVGTHHILSRTYTDAKISEIMINGWSLESSLVNDKGEVAFLLAPADTSGNDVPLSALWYVTESGEQYRISMPSDIKKGILTQKKIYAVSKEGIYYMNFNGQKRGFSKLPFEVDEIVGVCGDSAVILKSGNEYYLAGLNK